MDTKRMIRELRTVANNHKDDKLFTGQLDINLMCTQVANHLEELYNNVGNLIASYYVIQNKDGKYFLNSVEIAPIFVNNYEYCDKFETYESAENIFKSEYGQQFSNELKDCKIMKINTMIKEVSNNE